MIALIVGSQVMREKIPEEKLKTLRQLDKHSVGRIGWIVPDTTDEVIVVGLLLKLEDEPVMGVPDYDSYKALIAVDEYFEQNGIPAKMTTIKPFIVRVKQ